jgi:hypothetical protein
LLGVALALVVGWWLGFLTMALLAMASRSDDDGRARL